MPSFATQCYDLIKTVPKGRVTTYKAIANALGVRSYRAVGQAMRLNPNAPCVPCHRVVTSDGELSGYAYGTQKKIDLLAEEGVEVKEGKIVDFEQKLYTFE